MPMRRCRSFSLAVSMARSRGIAISCSPTTRSARRTCWSASCTCTALTVGRRRMVKTRPTSSEQAPGGLNRWKWCDTRSKVKGQKAKAKTRMKKISVLLGAMLTVLAVAPIAAQLSPRAPRPQVVPPQGPVRQVIFKNCTNCHGIDDYAYNALDRAGWDTLITAKHRGLDVPLLEKERGVLLDWLEVRFGPTTKPFPRTYIAREVTTFFTDGEA